MVLMCHGCLTIPLLIDGHLGCSSLGDSRNKVAMNLGTFVCRFCCDHKFSFLWDKCLAVELLGLLVAAHSVSKETQHIFQSVPFHIPTSNI